VQKELADDRAVACQVPLETANVFEAFVPDVLVTATGGAFRRRAPWDARARLAPLVIRAVEDSDMAALGQMLRGAPQEVMLQFGTRRLLEGVDLNAFWIYSGHDVIDGAIFSGGVEGLEDEKQRPAILA